MHDPQWLFSDALHTSFHIKKSWKGSVGYCRTPDKLLIQVPQLSAASLHPLPDPVNHWASGWNAEPRCYVDSSPLVTFPFYHLFYPFDTIMAHYQNWERLLWMWVCQNPLHTTGKLHFRRQHVIQIYVLLVVCKRGWNSLGEKHCLHKEVNYLGAQVGEWKLGGKSSLQIFDQLSKQMSPSFFFALLCLLFLDIYDIWFYWIKCL